MRPVPIPDWLRNADWVEGTQVFAAPDGDLTSTQIPPAEGVFYQSLMSGYGEELFPMVAVLLEFDAAEVEAIAAGKAKHVLLPWHGRRMPVFVVPTVIMP